MINTISTWSEGNQHKQISTHNKRHTVQSEFYQVFSEKKYIQELFWKHFNEI